MTNLMAERSIIESLKRRLADVKRDISFLEMQQDRLIGLRKAKRFIEDRIQLLEANQMTFDGFIDNRDMPLDWEENPSQNRFF